MDYDSPAALYAGLIAGAIMLIPIYVGRMMMPDQMKMDLLKMIGTMMLPISGITMVVGLMIHAVMSMVFSSAHAAFYQWFDITGSLIGWGLLFGAVHWVAVGMAFGMITASTHRGIRDGDVEAPGFFAMKLGGATAMGVLVVHLLFGLMVGVFYEAFA